MKKLFLLFLGLMLVACSNKEDNEIEKTFQEDILEISIKASENVKHRYVLMENFPTEGGPVITRHPKHASVSKIEYSDSIYYVYQPQDGFTGTDMVEITNNISNGFETVAQTILSLTIKVNDK